MKETRSRARRQGWGTIATCLVWMHLSTQAAAGTAKALSVQIDETRWIGDDGSWSPVSLGIGSPIQGVDLFPSTTGQEILVIGTAGCGGNTQCQTSRGGTFASNVSTTFQSRGQYQLGSDRTLGGSGAGFYGLDTVNVGGQNSVVDQIVGIINSTEYWVGLLGLGTENSTVGISQVTSLLESLAGGDAPEIPSLSYGYSAGAYYRSKQVPCSLTLGGYDQSRFTPSNATFTLSPNQQPRLAVQSISVSGLAGGQNASVMGAEDQAIFTIDSSTPFLYLPESVAEELGSRLGLIYNDALDLFLYANTSQYNKLASSKLMFTFGFSNQLNSPIQASLNIDGQAFTTTNLSYDFPFLNATTNSTPVPYFPVRKTANPLQYTLGRAFLQETYLIVDYTRNNFSLSEALFNSTAANIIDIIPPAVASSPPGGSTTSLSVGVQAGIGIGIAAFVLIVAFAAYRYSLLRKRAARAKVPPRLLPTELENETKSGSVQVSAYETGSELPASSHVPSSQRSLRDQTTSPSRTDSSYHVELADPESAPSVQGRRELLDASTIPVFELPGSLHLPPPNRSPRTLSGTSSASRSPVSLPSSGSRPDIVSSPPLSAPSETARTYYGAPSDDLSSSATSPRRDRRQD